MGLSLVFQGLEGFIDPEESGDLREDHADGDHDGENVDAVPNHVEHEQGYAYRHQRRFSKFPSFL